MNSFFRNAMATNPWLIVAVISVLLPTDATAQAPDPVVMLQRLDKDSSGNVSRDEAPPKLKGMFEQFDEDRDGVISLDEMKKNLPTAFGARGNGRKMLRPGEVIAPAALKERKVETLKAGDAAPPFKLPTVSGEKEVSLRDLIGDKPVILVFGSISCSPFRQRIEIVERLHQEYKDRVHFVMIYIREAHPDSVIVINTADGSEKLQKFTQTDDVKLRNEHAQACSRTLKLSFPMLVDTVDNKTNIDYAGWPIRLIVIGTDGKVIDPGAPGPQGFQPEKLEAWLKSYSAQIK